MTKVYIVSSHLYSERLGFSSIWATNKEAKAEAERCTELYGEHNVTPVTISHKRVDS